MYSEISRIGWEIIFQIVIVHSCHEYVILLTFLWLEILHSSWIFLWLAMAKWFWSADSKFAEFLKNLTKFNDTLDILRALPIMISRNG